MRPRNPFDRRLPSKLERNASMDEDTSESIEVEISDTQSHLRVDTSALAGLVRRVLAGEGVSNASISIALVDNATIHALNRQYLGHDWPTDVISFVLSEPDDPVLSGELIVSAEMAAETARAGGMDPAAELALYLVHGLLHLCGQDDLTPEAAATMRRREAEILAREKIVNPYSIVDLASDGERGSQRCPA